MEPYSPKNIFGWKPKFAVEVCTQLLSVYDLNDFLLVILNKIAFSSLRDSTTPFVKGIVTEKNAPNLIPFADSRIIQMPLYFSDNMLLNGTNPPN